MPKVSGLFGPIFASTVLDASGNGYVTFQATGQSVTITNRSVKVSTTVLEASATTYLGQIGTAYRLDATQAGSTGDNNSDPIVLKDGERVYVQWLGGDVGATATATFSGTAQTTGGFRAMV